MHVAFYRSPKERCADFTSHFMAGVQKYGDSIEERSINGDLAEHQDVAVILGVKKKRLFAELIERGTPMVYIDKGYTREWTHRRISIGDCQPSAYLSKWRKPSNRRIKFDWHHKPWRQTSNPLWNLTQAREANDRHILLAWSSPGYHIHCNLPPPEEYATTVINEIKVFHSSRRIVWRQKPNQPRIEIPGATISEEGSTIEHDLSGAHVMITVGSSVCLQAVQMGVPSIVLGDAIGAPISSTELAFVEKPYLAPPAVCEQWLNDLAYCQWSLEEYASGEAWAEVRPEVELLRHARQKNRKV